MTETDYASAVALIGMSGRFPGADSPKALWRNLIAGVKGLRELTEDELRAAGVEPGKLADPRYVRIGAPLRDLDQFDASIFGITPREAQSMDPQHRLFLECAWESLESAGYCPTEMPGQVGVFAGSGFPDYMLQNIPNLVHEPGGPLLVAVGNERDSLASFVSYKLGLKGPAIGVQTFCSTSLVSVHLACQSLLTYECDIALAGGAYIPLPQPVGYLYEQGGITAPDGQVRSFDAEAGGTVMGSGVGAVTLKRMTEAIEDGDIIHAVILGSAVNNDGRVRAGYQAPGVDGQAEVIESALGVAGVKPDSVDYVECHATATVMGDSVELAAMNRVFAPARDTPCVLGSLKPSIGHLDRASGVTGLMRATLALENEILPATPNYSTPNPALAGARDRFTVLTEHRPWETTGDRPRRAGVSSFGLGGTNAHVVLEQAPAREDRPHRPGPHLLAFSAGDKTALAELTESLRVHLAEHPEVDIADVAYTLQMSRGGFPLRRAVVVRDAADAVLGLGDETRWIDGLTQRRNPKVVLTDGAVPDGWWSETVTPAETLTRLGVRVVRDQAEGTGDIGEAERVVVGPGDGASADEWLLTTLATLWEAGSVIDWRVLHQGAGRRVELPPYPFQRRRYWVEAPKDGPNLWGSPVQEPDGKIYDRGRWTHLPAWRPLPRAVADLDERLRLAGPWLVLAGDERGEALVEHLITAGADVVAARPGHRFEQEPSGDFRVRVDETDDFGELLAGMMVAPRTIVHGFSLASPAADPSADPVAHFTTEQPRGFYSALALAKQLVDTSGMSRAVDLVLLTSGAADVVGSDLRHPEHSTLAALGPSLAQENPRLRCRHIDVDTPAGTLRPLVRQVLTGIVAPHEGPIAIRGGQSRLRHYHPYPIQEPEDNRPIHDGDTVFITGGLGDVGLTLARHLAGKYHCKLVLTARSPLPPRDSWEAYLADVPEGGERAARHIRNIRELEEQGAEVLAMTADVGDLDAMRAIVTAAVERFGDIDVVVHAAGVQAGEFFNFAHLMTAEQCDAHFNAKVRGFHTLRAALGDQQPRLCMAFSSVAAILGGMVLAPYAAANAALDAYSALARMADEGPWITVDWDTWNIDPERLEIHGPKVRELSMVPAEGADVFERTLSASDEVGHLVISTGSLAARLATWVIGEEEDDDDEADDRERHPRPDLSTPFVKPAEGTEEKLAEIWSRVLGVEPIGATDNFFELGGHSLIAIDLTARLRKAFGAAIPITGLLESPTVRQLAALIDGGASSSDGGAADATA